MNVRYYEFVYDPVSKTMVRQAKWRDEGPGRASTGHARGELVVGVSDRERERANQRKMREQAA